MTATAAPAAPAAPTGAQQGPHPSPSPRSRHLRPVKAARRLVVVLAALAVGVFALDAPASAYEQATRYTPGQVTPYQVQGMHYNACAGTLITCFNPYLVVPGPAVTRSRATRGAQDVRVGYQLLRWNGSSWYQVTWAASGARIGRGQRAVTVAGRAFEQIPAGHFKVTMMVQWYRAGTNRLLGQRTTFYNGYDYGCYGRFTRFCSTAQGWVYLRSPM
jgi:hypothetical protein